MCNNPNPTITILISIDNNVPANLLRDAKTEPNTIGQIRLRAALTGSNRIGSD